MTGKALAFLVGVLVALGWPAQPFLCLGGAAFAIVAAWRSPPARVLLLFALVGAAWCQLQVSAARAHRLGAPQEAWVGGCVAGPVVADGDRLHFDFGVVAPPEGTSLRKIHLSWYRPTRVPAVGECWRLRARLLPPRGLVNPYGTDYERYAFTQRLDANGYVLVPAQAERVSAARWRKPLLRLRLSLAQRLRFVIGERPERGLLVALAVGFRHGISERQWRLFRDTGTSHLMAISGLHVGLLAGFGYAAGRWLAPAATCRANLLRRALVVALAMAGSYAALAGFSLPTQRALVMLLAFSVARWSARRVAALDTLGFSVIAVLLLDPFAVLGLGFWFSFAAVATLLAVGTLGRSLVGAQAGLFLGLAPLTLLAAGRLSLVSPLANLVCVPLFCVTVIPLALAGAFVAALSFAAGSQVLGVVATLLGVVLTWLEALAGLTHSTLELPQRPFWTLLLAALSVGLFLVPLVRARLLAVVLCLPFFFGQPERLARGAFRVTVLDVGQGLAALVETRKHTLVYDTGDRWRRSDAGAAVIVPHLRGAGISRLSALIVSHADRDHSGGSASVLGAVHVARIYSGEPVPNVGRRSEPCRRGRVWQYDGVHFQFLHPDAQPFWSGNNASCVLRVSAGDDAVLLTGDAEALVEIDLYHAGVDLTAAIVVGQHHGSRTSSTAGFVAATNARYVVFATGFANRWDLPSASVRARWRRAGTRVLDTAADGAVVFHYRPGQGFSEPWLARRAKRSVWRLPPTATGGRHGGLTP